MSARSEFCFTPQELKYLAQAESVPYLRTKLDELKLRRTAGMTLAVVTSRAEREGLGIHTLDFSRKYAEDTVLGIATLSCGDIAPLWGIDADLFTPCPDDESDQPLKDTDIVVVEFSFVPKETDDSDESTDNLLDDVLALRSLAYTRSQNGQPWEPITYDGALEQISFLHAVYQNLTESDI